MLRRILFAVSCGLIVWVLVTVVRADLRDTGTAVGGPAWEDQVFAMNEQRRLVGGEMIVMVRRVEDTARTVEGRARALVAGVRR